MQSDQPKLISSVYGEITAILLVYPGLATDQGDEEYADIVKVFDKKGDVYRFRKEVHDFKLALGNFRDRSRGDEGRFREIYELEPGMDIVLVLRSWSREMDKVRKKGTMTFERWAQDPFLVLGWDGLTILLNSLHNQRMCDFFLPLEVAQQMGSSFLVQPIRLYLEGGNILCSDKVAFVGKDLVKKNCFELELEDPVVIEQLKQAFGVDRIISVGMEKEYLSLKPDGGPGRETWQPLFHIDVFMNLAGKGKNGKEIIFWGSPEKCSELLQATNEMGLKYSEIEARAFEMFEKVQGQLADHGFRIIEIPIFFQNDRIYSWNNCLVEVSKTGKQVYLPSYQTTQESDHEKLNPTFKVLEDSIEKIYRAHGFKVHWFRHGRFFRTIAEHGGSLHCIVKVIRRKNSLGLG